MVDHEALLRGLDFNAKDGSPIFERCPTIFERTEDEFIHALMEDLQSEQGRKDLADRHIQPSKQGEDPKLFQPVHQAFNLALVDLSCDVFGHPRLDPAKVESAGLVVRKVTTDSRGHRGRLAWMRKEGTTQGYHALSGTSELDRDPEAARRPKPKIAASSELNHKLLSLRAEDEFWDEAVTPMFVAPPDVCAAVGRTVFYGLIPVTSAERAKQKTGASYELDEVKARLSPYFSATSSHVSVSLGSVANTWVNAASLQAEDAETGASKVPAALESFAGMLRLMVSVFNAFEDAALVSALDQVILPYANMPSGRTAGQALKEAAAALVFGEQDGTGKNKRAKSFLMPSAWPVIGKAQAEKIEQAALVAANKRMKALIAGGGRFDDPKARYEVRVFARVKREDGCPPKLFWSSPSLPFKIAAWYENGKLAPIPIALPDVTRDNVKKLLPNIAFQVPAGIFDLLGKNKPKDFIEGSAQEGTGELQWLCGFNIPIITLCAFIVLFIFLTLLNLIFWWLPFIKICIPLPKSLQIKGEFP